MTEDFSCRLISYFPATSPAISAVALPTDEAASLKTEPEADMLSGGFIPSGGFMPSGGAIPAGGVAASGGFMPSGAGIR